jgi:gamma-glutamylcyclotransferase (GGCT)/AIG2-like uncharacterized protein YtfP
MGSVYLFVYGSLKRGGLHHDDIAGCGGSRFLGAAQTLPGYGLVSLGDYLALVAGGGAGDRGVSGELFEVQESLLPRLDEFEGADYERGQVAIAAPAAGDRGPLQFAHLPFALAYFRKAR